MAEIERLAGDPSVLRQLEILARISAVSSELRRPEVPLDRIDPGGRFTAEGLKRDVAAMRDRQWIEYSGDYDGIDEVSLQPQGRSIAREFTTLRQNKSARFTRLVDDLLKWLYECERQEVPPPDIGAIRTSPHGAFIGLQYGYDELAHATRWLKAEGYIAAQEQIGQLPAYPRLTPLGRQIVDRGVSVFSTGRNAIRKVEIVEIDGQVASAGASGLTTEERGQLERTIGMLRSLVETYPESPATREIVEAELEELESEIAEPEPSRAKVRERLLKVQEKIADSGIPILPTIVGVIMQQALQGE